MARIDKSIAMYGDWETEATLVAQRLLNEAAMNGVYKGDILTMDGKFGDRTLKAVRAFQTASRKLVVDGVVGPKTFAELGLKTELEHSLKLLSQRTRTTCWLACSTMLNAGWPPKSANAEINADGSLVATDANMTIYATDLGWKLKCAPVQPATIIAMLQQDPLWVGGTVAGHASGVNLHVVVLAGVFSYQFSGLEVVFKVYDPWPQNSGTIYFSKGSKLELENAGVFTPHWYMKPEVCVL